MDELDTNLDNYSVSDLLQIIGLNGESEISQIQDNTNTLIAKMKSEGKQAIANFFENAKSKILNDIDNNESNEDESNDSNDSIVSDVSNVSEYIDNNVVNINAIEENVDNEIPNSFTNHPETITQTICFDTRFRSNYYGTISTSYTIDLPETQKKVISLSINSIEIPNTHYTISSKHGNNNMIIVSDDLSYNDSTSINNPSTSYKKLDGSNATNFHISATNKAWLAKLVDGNYNNTWDENTSLTENMVNEAISMAIPGAVDAQGHFAAFQEPSNNFLNNNIQINNDDISNPNGDLRYAIDRITKKSVFAGGINNFNTIHSDLSNNPLKISSIRFNVDKYGNLDINTNIQFKLGWQLGFRAAEYILGNQPITTNTRVSAVSEGAAFKSGTKHAFLSIEDYQNNVQPSFLLAYGDSMKDDNIMARINLTFREVNDKERRYFGPVDIKRLTINVKDEYGRVVDLNNMDWFFSLSFEKQFN